jgi:galactose mutarotase-like enzyme
MPRGAPEVGGLPIVALTAPTADGVVSAHVAPGRGMMLLKAAARSAGGPSMDLIEAPPLDAIAGILDGGPADFAGNAAFSFGGAILAPYANRITGEPAPGRTLRATIDGRTCRLPMNWGGKAAGARQYAMHGLILDLAFTDFEQPSPGVLHGQVRDHDFGGRWPSRADIGVTWRLAHGGLELEVSLTNVGAETLPLGIGWHPYFRIPSGRREQARLHIPATARLVVNNYDEVLPTGDRERVAGTAYDVAQPGGLELGALHLDDCFTGLPAGDAVAVAEITDPAGDLRIRLRARAPPVRAVQVYAPPGRPLICVEPQFNWADPFGDVWGADVETGMVKLEPGDCATYWTRTEVEAGSTSRDVSRRS